MLSRSVCVCGSIASLWSLKQNMRGGHAPFADLAASGLARRGPSGLSAPVSRFPGRW